MYRQGDVLLIPVPSVPTKVSKISQGHLVLAEGEATGHAHVIDSPTARLFRSAPDERFIQLAEKSLLRHEEHSRIELPAGNYRVVIQREFVRSGEVRPVND